MSVPKVNLAGFAAVLRPRLEFQDAVIVVAIICAATLFAFEYDFFESVDRMSVRERRITVQEYFALTGLLIVSLIGFSVWRLRKQKHEFALRLGAEMAAREALHDAMHDPLTALPNRRALMIAMNAVINDAAASGSHALILLDLNGFKAVNDRHGHGAGDHLLETIARRVRTAVDGTRVPARLGGDEFAVFCPGVRHADEIRLLAHHLVASIEQPIEIAGVELRVGAGAGIAFYPQDAHTTPDLFRCADAALYRAKASKQSAVACHSDAAAQVNSRRALRD